MLVVECSEGRKVSPLAVLEIIVQFRCKTRANTNGDDYATMQTVSEVSRRKQAFNAALLVKRYLITTEH